MNRECKNATRCNRCFLEACPFGRNGNRDDGIGRLARASSRTIHSASLIPNEEEYKKAQAKIALALRDLMKQTGRNLLDEKVQLCIHVSCCVAYKVNVEIVPDNCKVNLEEL